MKISLTQSSQKTIKVLKTLVCHLSREPLKEMGFKKKTVIYDEQAGRTKQRTNNLRDGLIWERTPSVDRG